MAAINKESIKHIRAYVTCWSGSSKELELNNCTPIDV